MTQNEALKVVFDPASPEGDYGCIVKYKISKDGVYEIKAIRYLDKTND